MSKLLKKSTYGAAILLAYTVLTFALAAHDAGVKQEVDEFTGEQSCSQIVINSVSDFTGISLLTGDFPEEIMILVVREIPRRGDAVFNMFGTLSGDKVYVRFPSLDEVEQFEPIHTTVEYLDSGRRYEGA